MVTPRSNDEPTHILLNTKIIEEYTEDGSMTWVGTFAHKSTHTIDYNQFAKREGLNSLDIIEGTSKAHQIFICFNFGQNTWVSFTHPVI